MYSIIYPDIHYSTNCRWFDLKSSFQLICTAYKNKKNAELAKDPSNNKDKNVHLKFEQKSIEVDSYNKIEEEKMREKIESRKQKRRKLAGKNKALQWKKRREQNEAEEKQLWEKVRLFKQGA